MTPTAVYRLYDAAGRLLYVGASRYPDSRLKDHARTAAWWDRVARKAIEYHPDKKRALAAEAAAIKTEYPEFNIMHAMPSVPPRERLAEWGERHAPLMAEYRALVRLGLAAGIPIEEISQILGMQEGGQQ